MKKDINQMRVELVEDLGLKITDQEKKVHIAFVEQNSSILDKYHLKFYIGPIKLLRLIQ